MGPVEVLLLWRAQGEVRECECVSVSACGTKSSRRVRSWCVSLRRERGNAMACVDALRPSPAFSGLFFVLPSWQSGVASISLSPGNLRVETRGVVHRGMRKGVEACGEERSVG